MDLRLAIPGDLPADVVVQIVAPRLRPADLEAWIAELATLPGLVEEAPVPFATELGLAAVAIRGRLVDEAGASIARRVLVVYSFHHLVAAASVAAPELRFAAHGAALEQLLAGARPILGGDEPVALSEIDA